VGVSGECEEVEEEGGGGVGRRGGREGGKEGWREGYVCETGKVEHSTHTNDKEGKEQ